MRVGHQRGFRVEHLLHLHQSVLYECAARRHDVEDAVGHAYGGGYLHRARYLVNVGLDGEAVEVGAQNVGVGCGHAAPVEPGRAVVLHAAGHGQRNAASAEAEAHHLAQRQVAFGHLVQPHNAHIGHAHVHGLWYVVVAQVEHFDGEACGACHEFAFALCYVDAGVGQQRHGVFVKPALGLYGYSQHVFLC